MNVLESVINSSEDGLDASKKYVDKTYKYTKLKTFKFLALAFSSLTKLLLIGTAFFVSIMFIAIAVSLEIGEYYNNTVLGYLITGGAFFVMGLLIILIRKSIDKKILKAFSIQFFES